MRTKGAKNKPKFKVGDRVRIRLDGTVGTVDGVFANGLRVSFGKPSPIVCYKFHEVEPVKNHGRPKKTIKISKLTQDLLNYRIREMAYPQETKEIKPLETNIWYSEEKRIDLLEIKMEELIQAVNNFKTQ